MCVLMFATGVMHGSIGLRLRAAVPFALLLGGAIVWSNDSRPIEERLVAMCAVLGGCRARTRSASRSTGCRRR